LVVIDKENLLAAIAKSSNLEWLEQCQRHNLKQGNLDVAEAAEQRIRDLELQVALRIRPDAKSVEERVLESVRVYRELLKHKHGRNQAAGYTEREIRQHGPREALIRTIRRGKKTDGLKTLALYGRLDCAYERIAIDHADELPADIVEQARQTIAEFSESASE
jgi:hypothetical protein